MIYLSDMWQAGALFGIGFLCGAAVVLAVQIAMSLRTYAEVERKRRRPPKLKVAPKPGHHLPPRPLPPRPAASEK